MEKIISKESNSLGIDIFINGKIDVLALPKGLLESIAMLMETEIINDLEKKRQKKKKEKKFMISTLNRTKNY